jgi:hypothetical protein
MYCVKCGNTIPKGRIDALPNTKTCVACADTQKVGVFTVISGKNTYSEIQIVSQETAKLLNAKQARRGQSPGAGMRGTS